MRRRQAVKLTGRSSCASLRRTSSWSYRSPLPLLPPPSRVGSACRAGGLLVIGPEVIGATSGRLRGLRTKDGAASSSSSSSVILTSR